MKQLAIDPSLPIHVRIEFQSVHVAAFRLRAKPKEGEWEVFAKGTHKDHGRTFIVGPVPWGGRVDCRFLYTDDHDGDDFAVRLVFLQDGSEIQCAPLTVVGEAGKFGVEAEVELSEICAEE